VIRIELLGTPAPQGSKKFVGMAGGRGVMVESSKKVRPWRQDVKAAAELVMAGRPPLDGPLVAVMTFTLPKPTSAPKRIRTWPCRKPDASKLARSTEDALTDAGVWTDDARVVDLLVLKRFPNEGHNALRSPGVVIEIFAAGEVEILVSELVERRVFTEQPLLIPPRVAEDVFG
jgi:Holliday junction resolvase RusA-like endonuclease